MFVIAIYLFIRMIHKNLFIVQKQHNFVPRIRLQTEESPYSKFKPKRKNETP